MFIHVICVFSHKKNCVYISAAVKILVMRNSLRRINLFQNSGMCGEDARFDFKGIVHPEK